MYSLNAPVPGRVARIASKLHPQLAGFDRVRERHSLLVKRLGDADQLARLERRVRRALAGTPAFEVAVSHVDVFDEPSHGSGPVVYLAVDAPALYDLHERLLDEFPPVDDIEGAGYTPHVTLARGGDREAARRLAGREVGPTTWTVSELHLWDATYDEVAARVPLPA